MHLWYFDRTTIRRLMETSGFDVQAIRPHYQRLELDYILLRGAVLSGALSKSQARRSARSASAAPKCPTGWARRSSPRVCHRSREQQPGGRPSNALRIGGRRYIESWNRTSGLCPMT